MSLLQVLNLSVRYGDRTVVSGAALSLVAGEVVALIGPNGSGKSSLLRAVLDLIPSEGSIAWEDRPLAKWDRRLLARRVAYLPQSPTHEPGQTVRDVLRMGRSPYWGSFGIESGRDAEIVETVFTSLDLPDRDVDSLSGGQRQRVFVGRCLVQEPAAMVLDEPDTYLDLKHVVEMHRQLRELAKSRQIGILMTSHDLNAAISMADRVVLLSEGRVVADGVPSDVMRADVVSTVFGVEMERIERDRGIVLIPKR